MKTVELVCCYEQCGKTFQRNAYKVKSNPSKRVFCSEECKRLGQIRRTGTPFSKSGPYDGVHICPICEVRFTPHHPSVVYCGDICRDKRRNDTTVKNYKERAVVGLKFTPSAKRNLKLTMLETFSVCGICGVDFSTLDIRQIHLDHCHTTGKIRGLLCFKCNAGLGQMNDDIERLKQAIQYLEQFNEEHG